jgi:hypothetical protein
VQRPHLTKRRGLVWQVVCPRKLLDHRNLQKEKKKALLKREEETKEENSEPWPGSGSAASSGRGGE